MSRLIFTILLITASNYTFSQVFGGNPSSIKWKKIDLASTNIIFPAGRDSSAERSANIIHFINERSKSQGNKSPKVSIVFQNQNTIANGYVGLGPFRSEFFLTPDQNSFELGSIPSVDQLTVHEYRHIQQYNSFNVGLSHLMHVLFGQEGQALANNTAIPNWFFEGDAVFAETRFTEQGRGRLPFFYHGFSALWNENRNYTWMKLRNGSFKDFVPDHYPLGYMLVAYGNEKYGEDFWPNVTHDAAAFKNIFYPFQKAIKRYSGENYKNFRQNATNFFKDTFKTKDASVSKGRFISEEYPSFISNDSILFIESGFKQIPFFVVKDEKNPKKVRTQDYTLDNYFSYKNGKIVYASVRPDIRWGYRIYNDLRIIDLKTGAERSITKKTRYFSPDLSEDGKTIIAVNQAVNGNTNLEILNSETGKLVRSLPNPQKLFYTYPKYYGNKIITAVRNSKGEMSLAIINADTDSTEILLPFTFNVIGFPAIQNDTIYFSCSYFNNDELFAFTLLDKKLWKINAENSIGKGKYYPTVSETKIAWSSFTSKGYKIRTSSKSDVNFQPVNIATLETSANRDFGITVLQSESRDQLSQVGNEDFQISKYKKSNGLFHFHSIEPAVNDPDYSLTWISENILNTMQSSISLGYNRAEKSKSIDFVATYAALFPFLSAGMNYNIDRKTIFHGETVSFNELQPYAGISVPLNFSKNRFFRYLNFTSQYVYNESSFTGLYKDSIGSISYSYLNNFFSFTNQVQKAKQQIFPRFAQSVSLSYKTALSKFEGQQFLVQGNFYFPGILKTHSVVFGGGFLLKDSLRQVSFSSNFPFSRGYQAVNLFRMNEFSINYHLPLAYPDAGFANILYFLRVKANLFYDQTHVKEFKISNRIFNQYFRSAGAEITFDTKWWNQAEISFGFRYSYLLDEDTFGGTGRNRWELILPVNIFQ